MKNLLAPDAPRRGGRVPPVKGWGALLAKCFFGGNLLQVLHQGIDKGIEEVAVLAGALMHQNGTKECHPSRKTMR